MYTLSKVLSKRYLIFEPYPDLKISEDETIREVYIHVHPYQDSMSFPMPFPNSVQFSGPDIFPKPH